MFRLKYNSKAIKSVVNKKFYNTQKPKNVFDWRDPLMMEKLLTEEEIEIRDVVRKKKKNFFLILFGKKGKKILSRKINAKSNRSK